MLNVTLILIGLSSNSYLGFEQNCLMLWGDFERLLIEKGCEYSNFNDLVVADKGKSVTFESVNYEKQIVYKFFVTKIN
jgi:hypothetical protein